MFASCVQEGGEKNFMTIFCSCVTLFNVPTNSQRTDGGGWKERQNAEKARERELERDIFRGTRNMR